MNEDVKAWVDHSDYDLESARVLFQAGQQLNVLFLYQQAVQKRLKAVLVHKTGRMTLRIHDLLRLAKAVGKQVSTAEEVLLRRLTTFYRETRYPDALELLTAPLTIDEVQDVYDQIQEILQWCDQQMK